MGCREGSLGGPGSPENSSSVSLSQKVKGVDLKASTSKGSKHGAQGVRPALDEGTAEGEKNSDVLETDNAQTLPDGSPILPCREVGEDMACIPGGAFIRGSDTGPEHSRPQQEIWLQTFYMDVYEVTNQDYRRCRKEQGCLRGGPLYNDFHRKKQPIVGVSWFAALKYCELQGKSLPSEAQWEKAARGNEGHLHPWGDDPSDCEKAVIKDEKGRSCGVRKKKEHPRKGRTFVVGSRPPGVYGLYDMMGNAWEWVYDWMSPDYSSCGKDCAKVDPKGPCDGALECPGHQQRVVRGGSWYWPAKYATGAWRRSHYPENKISDFHHFGFRCAASDAQVQAMEKETRAAAEGKARPPS